MPWWLLFAPLVGLSSAATAAAGTVGGVAVTAGVTYLLGRRTASGTVSTSTASDLWSAVSGLQKDTFAALVDQRAYSAKLEGLLEAETSERRRLEVRVLVLERQLEDRDG